MKVIIAGGRDITDYSLVESAVAESGFTPTLVISGCAPGADTLGEEWASKHNVSIQKFPADWNTHGKAAGPIRNRQMVAAADALIALHDGESRGTADCIKAATKAGIKVFVFKVKP